MSSCETLLHTFASATEPLRMEELFDEYRPTELEIGCGDGGFLLGYAQANTQRNFIGVERLLGRIRKLDRKGRRDSLQNLCLLRIEARYLIQYLLPEHQMEAMHVYFPDPWPKDRHARHRLIDEEFPGHTVRLLKPGGVIHLRTDDAAYFGQMQAVFRAHGGFEPESTPTDLAARVTEFEADFNAQGKPIHSASWRLI